MKTIGFIDYYLSEWHANNYPGWIKEICDRTGEEYRIAYAWGEIPSPLDGLTSQDWCDKFGAECCGSIEEVCEKADFLMILSPSNPEKHLGYAEIALRYGKPTYIDKTFAPDYATAEAIFRLGETYHAPFFSTSALRYAQELEGLAGNCRSLLTLGGGSSIEEYCIHQIEMICMIMQAAPEAVKVERRGSNRYEAAISFGNGRQATLVFSPSMPFVVDAELDNGEYRYLPVESSFFSLLLADVLRFFGTRQLPFDAKETLYAMKLRDMLLSGVSHD